MTTYHRTRRTPKGWLYPALVIWAGCVAAVGAYPTLGLTMIFAGTVWAVLRRR